MKYGIVTDGRYIYALSINAGQPLSEAEYNRLKAIFANKPEAPHGYICVLNADTNTWEFIEGASEPIDDEATAEELLNILTGETA